MKIENALLVYTKPKNTKEQDTLHYIEDSLRQCDIDFLSRERFSLKKSDFKKQDMVITLGGDGTFLRASHFIFDKTPVFGINLDPKNKEGFFAVADKKNFKEKFHQVLAGRFQMK